jgi:ketosteroid isomerase-like protein
MQSNVDVVRKFLWAFDKDTEAFRKTLHTEIEWFPFEEAHTPSYGVEDAMRCRNQWLEAWEEHRMHLEELVQKGRSVIASLHVRARGKASGVEVNVRLHPHYKVRDDRVVYIFEHGDWQSALEAAGLAS